MNQGLLSVDDALAKLLASAKPVAEVEEVPTLEATKRVLARAQRSTMDVPSMDNSAMDGFAVRRADVSPGKKFNVAQKVMAGAVGKPLPPEWAMVQIGRDTYEDLTAESFEKILDAIVRGEAPKPGPQNGRQYSAPLGGETTLKDMAASQSGKT